ncbi:MAG: hypothetical protein ACQER9_00070 [Nanobdellota archaeon]
MKNKQKKGSFALMKLISYIIPIIVFLVLLAFIFQDDLKAGMINFADKKQQEMEDAGELYENYGEGRRKTGNNEMKIHTMNIAQIISSAESEKKTCIIDLSSEPYIKKPYEVFGKTSEKSHYSYRCQNNMENCNSKICNAQGNCAEYELEGISKIVYYRDDKGMAKKKGYSFVMDKVKNYMIKNGHINGIYFLKSKNKNEIEGGLVDYKIDIYSSENIGSDLELTNKIQDKELKKRFYTEHAIKFYNILILLDGHVNLPGILGGSDLKEEDADFSGIEVCEQKNSNLISFTEKDDKKVKKYLSLMAESINNAKKENCIIKLKSDFSLEEEKEYYFGFYKENNKNFLKDDIKTLNYYDFEENPDLDSSSSFEELRTGYNSLEEEGEKWKRAMMISEHFKNKGDKELAKKWKQEAMEIKNPFLTNYDINSDTKENLIGEVESFDIEKPIDDKYKKFGVIYDRDFVFNHIEEIGKIIKAIKDKDIIITSLTLPPSKELKVSGYDSIFFNIIKENGMFVKDKNYYAGFEGDLSETIKVSKKYLIKAGNNIYFYSSKGNEIDINEIDKEYICEG